MKDAMKLDPLYDAAVTAIKEQGENFRCTVSFLQRNLGIGFGRAATMYNLLVVEGVIQGDDASACDPDDMEDAEALTPPSPTPALD
jgi:DNA segregation ATPase FtsK/SpoIIIE-like protein